MKLFGKKSKHSYDGKSKAKDKTRKSDEVTNVHAIPESQKQRGKKIARVAVGLAVLVVIAFVYILYVASGETNADVHMQVTNTPTPKKTLSPTHTITVTSTPTPLPEKEVLPKYEEMLDEHPDLVGWIKIDGTKVDYPVVQSKNEGDPHYYLNRAIDGEESSYGTIYMDFRNDPKHLNRNTVIYGHNMKYGKMFGDLDEFMEEDFYKEHKTFTLNTIYEEMEWEIVNVFISDIYFYYIDTGIKTNIQFETFMDSCLEKSLYPIDIEIKPDDKIITLSTCIYEIYNGRLAIQARLITD